MKKIRGKGYFASMMALWNYMGMKKNNYIYIFLLVMVIGCVNIIPIPIHTNKSKFDSQVELSMIPIGIGSKFAPLNGLGLYKNSKMQKEAIVLTALVTGAHIFARGNSLHFNIDGEIVSFRSIDELTDIETYVGYCNIVSAKNTSQKRYLINRSFLKKLVNADKVVVKINLDKTYVEDIFTGSLAHKAFIKFDEKIESTFN